MPEEIDPRRRRVLGKVIKETRLARKCRSQRLLADIAGIGERSVAGVETGKPVSRATLAPIEAVFGWPNHKTTDYLNGDDDALEALTVQGDPITPKRPAGAGLNMDIVPPHGTKKWLRVLRTNLTRDEFFDYVDQISRPDPAEGSGSKAIS